MRLTALLQNQLVPIHSLKVRVLFLLVVMFLYALSPLKVFAADTNDTKAQSSYRAQNDVLYAADCDGSTSGGSGGGSGSTLSGDDNVSKVYNYLVSKGYSPAQAAGMVGNMMWESGGVNPKRLQGRSNPVVEAKDITPEELSSGSTGYGIVQWTPPGKMVNVVKAQGKDAGDLGVQLDFLYGQLNGGGEDSANSAVKATNTPEAAAIAFEEKYERHAADSSSATRQLYARAVFEKATKGTPYPPEVEAAIYKGGSSGSSSTASGTAQPAANTSESSCGTAAAEDNGECKNPFRDLKNSAPMRWDGGLDYGGEGGSGPVYAACPAEIVHVYATERVSGWPGIPGSYISYKMTAGKAKGLFMYIAEDCTPKVVTGDKVTTDQPICQYQQASAYLETGWSDNGQNKYVGWSDYPGADNGYASNSGVDVGKFLMSLGVSQGHVDSSGPSKVPPPAGWPKWDSGGQNVRV